MNAILTRDHVVEMFRAEIAAAPLSGRYSAEELETVYAFAYAQIAQGRFGEALPLFAFLTQYAPTVLHYLSGLGLCLRRLQRYDEAIEVYALVGILDPAQINATLQMAECLLAEQKTDAAIEMLSLLARHAEESGDNSVTSVRAVSLLEVLDPARLGSVA